MYNSMRQKFLTWVVQGSDPTLTFGFVLSKWINLHEFEYIRGGCSFNC